MSKTKNIYGGGSRTLVNGLYFEQTTSLNDALIKAGYIVKEEENGKWVIFDQKNEMIGLSLPQHKLYKYFLEPQGVDYKTINSKKWLPDDCFINIAKKTVFIIEKKFQSSPGSTDEKLPNCEFKKMMYQKLMDKLDYKVEYIYLFNDWFTAPRYKDVLEYIKLKKCYYFFNEIPLKNLGLK